MILVKCSKDYADEFDCEFFSIMTEKQWEKFVKSLDNISYPAECSFGTNEELIFDSKEEVLKDLEIKTISKEEAAVIKKLLGDSFGTGSGVIDCLQDKSSG